MNNKEFIKGLNELNIKYDDSMLELLEKYYIFLKDYNQHTNLTRIIEKEDVYLKHFYDSLTITKTINLNEINNLLDIGSGAGFPGVVLKIFYPHLNITCLDSNNKKTKFISLLSDELCININVVNDRAEHFVKKTINSFDVVTARAVANLRVLTEISVPFLKKEGYFIAMKGSLEDELKDTLSTIDKLKLTIFKEERFNLPIENSERTILVLQKNNLSNIKNLRPYEKIIKISL